MLFMIEPVENRMALAAVVCQSLAPVDCQDTVYGCPLSWLG